MDMWLGLEKGYLCFLVDRLAELVRGWFSFFRNI